MNMFKELGADLLFVEAIKSKEDMKTVIKEVPGYHMINLIEDGETPLLEINELEDIGFKIAVLTAYTNERFGENNARKFK
jgi:2-methylisocitrate lyase-like PEP mutase family enzyme